MAESSKRMLSFVAPIYEKSFWLRSFFDALGVDFDTLTKFFSTLRDQTHVPSVDWGIEFLERKYSIVPDRNLTLEQRRERLRIKASVHLPLNPAVIEKFAREHFGFECFLDESTPGFIKIIANHFTVDAPKFVTWLVEEKPAHLALGGKFLRTQYVGDEKFVVPIENPRVEFDPILPIDDADKIHFPRLFTGSVEVQVGLKTVDIARPHDVKGKIFVGQTLGEFGGKEISLARPFIFDGNRHQLYAAQALTKGGGLTINADLRDLPTYENLIESLFVELALADIALEAPGDAVAYPTAKISLKVRSSTDVYEQVTETAEIGLAAAGSSVPRIVEVNAKTSCTGQGTANVEIRIKSDGNRHQLYAAQTLTKGGGLTINANLRDLPPFRAKSLSFTVLLRTTNTRSARAQSQSATTN